MSKLKDEPLVDLQETVSKTEKFIEDNRKSLMLIMGAIVVIIGGYFGYKQLYLAPLEEKAQKEMFMAQLYFEKDSFNLAINGNIQNKGFKYIADEYGLTPSGNLAKYYLGICYLNTGKFEDAIEQLKSYNAKDDFSGSIAAGAIGDAYMELGKNDDAIKQYFNAANYYKNNLTSPIYLYKAARAYEGGNNYAEALKAFEQIKTEYPESKEGKEVDKYIAYIKTKAGIE